MWFAFVRRCTLESTVHVQYDLTQFDLPQLGRAGLLAAFTVQLTALHSKMSLNSHVAECCAAFRELQKRQNCCTNNCLCDPVIVVTHLAVQLEKVDDSFEA